MILKNMKKPLFIIIICCACLFALGLIFFIAQKTNHLAAENGKLKIAATIFPLADIAKNIVGDKIDVVQVLPSGASPHTFELFPAKVKELQGAKLVFKIKGLDDWVDNAAESLPDAKIIKVDKDIDFITPIDEDDAVDGCDPHYWLSAANGAIVAQNIFSEIVKLDSDNEDFYQENLKAYVAELERLNVDLKEELSHLQNKNIITFHGAWGYFAKEYGLNIAAVFEPSPGKEPAPQYVKNIFSAAKQYGIKAIFSEPQLPPDLLVSLLNDLGLKLYILDPLGGIGERMSYAELLKYNAGILIKSQE